MRTLGKRSVAAVLTSLTAAMVLSGCDPPTPQIQTNLWRASTGNIYFDVKEFGHYSRSFRWRHFDVSLEYHPLHGDGWTTVVHRQVVLPDDMAGFTQQLGSADDFPGEFKLRVSLEEGIERIENGVAKPYSFSITSEPQFLRILPGGGAGSSTGEEDSGGDE
jgi:hypothetical protein